MTLEEQFLEDYASGFNDAALLAVHSPELLADIVQDNNPQTDYFTGFFESKAHYQEQQQQKVLDDLSLLRSRSFERDDELERC